MISEILMHNVTNKQNPMTPYLGGLPSRLPKVGADLRWPVRIAFLNLELSSFSFPVHRHTMYVE